MNPIEQTPEIDATGARIDALAEQVQSLRLMIGGIPDATLQLRDFDARLVKLSERVEALASELAQREQTIVRSACASVRDQVGRSAAAGQDTILGAVGEVLRDSLKELRAEIKASRDTLRAEIGSHAELVGSAHVQADLVIRRWASRLQPNFRK